MYSPQKRTSEKQIYHGISTTLNLYQSTFHAVDWYSPGDNKENGDALRHPRVA